MARDLVLEELIRDEMRSVSGLAEKSMFGGRAWLLGGNLVCAARDDGMLVRLGKGRDTWALQIDGIEPMILRGRHMHGWVRASPTVYANDAMRERLVSCALELVRSLPRK